VNSFDADTERMMRANEANWDARTPIHLASAFYRRDPAGWFADFEWADLGRLEGVDLLHLQCHLGTETLVFARLGARVTGLDISGASVAAARRIAAENAVDATYVQSNVYSAAAVLGRRKFDVVYTGKGALCYLPDLPEWARVVAALLRPGGTLYVVEFHPLLNSLGVVPPPGGGQELLLRNDFLGGRGPVERDATQTYTDGPALTHATVAYEWMHGIGDVINSVVDAGLGIELLRETKRLPWPRWPDMVADSDGWFRLPDPAPRIPLLYALRVRKP
jgi:SAM-dependent methyltransferase